MRATPSFRHLAVRHLATAVGLLLPLAALPAQADPRTWVDPPAKSAGDKSGGEKGSADKAVAAKAAAPAKAEAAKAAPAKPTLAATSPARGRLAHTPRRVERVARRHAPAPRRLAETPAMNAVPTGYAPAGRVEAAQSLAMEYLSAVSSPSEAMIGATPRFYGTRVRFYGRPATLADLVDEKRGFARRWPERRYAARAFNTRCTADGSTCVVRAIVDFRAASPERGVVSKGASELVLEVSFAGQRPVIVAESGRVLHRGSDRAETGVPGAGRG